jgi:hypothetical protein
MNCCSERTRPAAGGTREVPTGSRLVIALTVGIALQCAFYYLRLPERVASHFGPHGEVDGWSSKASFLATTGGMGVGLGLLFMVLPAVVARLPPWMVNLPNRDYWLAPERRDETNAFVAAYLPWMGALTLLLMAVVLHGTYVANLRSPPSLGSAALWAVGAFCVLAGAWLVGFYVRFRLPPGARGRPA